MNDETLITTIFVTIDDLLQTLGVDPHPGPAGHLSLSEVLTLMVLHPLLKPFSSLKHFYGWVKHNLLTCFPNLVEYSRLTRLFVQAQAYLAVVLQKLANGNSFGLIADGTTVSVMETVRGPYAKSFRDARKVKCVSKRQWAWGFLLEMVIDQAGLITFFSLGTAAEVRQLQDIMEDLADRWLLCDRRNRGKVWHEGIKEEKQIVVKIRGGKERQWIENVFGALKNKLGLDKIRVRKTPAFLARLTAILCSYNLSQALNLPIWQFELSRAYPISF
jgi:hypothetical protein